MKINKSRLSFKIVFGIMFSLTAAVIIENVFFGSYYFLDAQAYTHLFYWPCYIVLKIYISPRKVLHQ